MKRLAVLWILVLATSCASVPKRGPDLSDARARALRHDILASLAKREGALRGLRGLASVRYGSKLLGVKGETAFALRRPDELRIDALSDFGSFASQVILAKGKILILWPAEGKYFLGAADREAMEKFLLIGLEPRDVVALFLGLVPLEAEENYRIVKAKADEIVLRSGKARLTAGRMGDRFVPRLYVEEDGQGSVRYEVRYDDFQENAGALFPERIQAEFRKPKSRIEVRFKDVETNPRLDPRLFLQALPTGSVPID